MKSIKEPLQDLISVTVPALFCTLCLYLAYAVISSLSPDETE